MMDKSTYHRSYYYFKYIVWLVPLYCSLAVLGVGTATNAQQQIHQRDAAFIPPSSICNREI